MSNKVVDKCYKVCYLVQGHNVDNNLFTITRKEDAYADHDQRICICEI